MKNFNILVASIIIFFCQLSSHAVPNDVQSWNAIVLEVPINKKFNFYLDVQPRIGDDVTQLSQLVVRPAIHYKLNDHVMIGQGFSWQPHVTPVFINENRPYQDIIYRKGFKKFSLTLRARTEERMISGTSGVSIRQRFLTRFNIPMGDKKKWGWVAANELFVNLNSLPIGPKGGLNQERVYLAVYRHLNENMTLEFGYMFNPVWNDYQSEYIIRHDILVTLNINLDKSMKHFYTPSVPY